MTLIDILYLVFIIFLFSAGWACFRGAPWVPTRKKDIERFLKLAEIKPSQKFYDLGCGDGRLVIEATKTGADAVGFELSLMQYLHAKINLFFYNLSNNHEPYFARPSHEASERQSKASQGKIYFLDFWNVNLGDADIVYLFLMQSIYPKLKAKFEKELKPGTKIIVYAWPIKGWTPVKIDRSPNSLPIYLYQI